MRKRGLFSAVVILIVLFSFGLSYGQSQQITNGLVYLSTSQNPDGSWGSETSGAELLPSTVSVMETFQLLGQTNTVNYSSAFSWLQAQGLDTTDYLSERIHALSIAGTDNTLLLSYLDEFDNAWGGYDDFDINTLDTALALQALKRVNYSDSTVINSAVDYLLSSQNPDGGWGLCQASSLGCADGEGDSNVYMTALVSSTLQQFPQTTAIATAINKATAYLLSHQNADGGFGTDAAGASTIYETSLAYIALVGVITDNTVLGNAVNYLTSTQLPDGSWDEDPYSTALALRALYYSENKPTPPPSPTSGTVTGRVIDASTSQPLAGALISSGQLAATTSGTGEFTLTNMPAGSQTVSVSLAGYATSTATVNITVGSITNLGAIPLSSNPTTGIIKGTVTDAATGQPLSGVTIGISGSYAGSATTGPDGSFTITGVTPGAVTITASLSGYYSISGTGTINAGGILFFSPKLSTTPPAATTGDLTGKVLDSVTTLPLQGAIITLSGGPSSMSDQQGAFLIQDIPPGTYNVNISASGYAGQSSSIMIMAGVTTDIGTVYLTPSPTSTTVSGKVTDLSTGQPIPNADVSIVGTTLSVKTNSNGAYSISGIDLLEFTVKASATGYDSKSLAITTTGYGNYTVDFALSKSQASDLKMTSLSSDKLTYGAYENVTITATISNDGTNEESFHAVAEIHDAADNVIGLAAPVEPVITIAPAATAEVTIQWNAGQFAPGSYRIVVTLLTPPPGAYSSQRGITLAQGDTTFEIEPTQMITGALGFTPPVVQEEAQTQVQITAAYRNTGNVPLTTTLRLEASAGGAVVYSKDFQVDSLAVNGVSNLEVPDFIPQTAADHVFTLRSLDADTTCDISGTLLVSSFGTASFTVSPSSAPAGNAKVAAKIHLQGATPKAGSSGIPLVSVIKDAIQKGVNYSQQSVMTWHTTHNCNGCHVQSQALVGLELSRDKVAVDQNASQTLYNALRGWQQADGSIGGASLGYINTLTQTQFGLWALTAWHDQEEAKPYILSAANYVVNGQSADGGWPANYSYYAQYGDRNVMTAYSMLGIAHAYALSNDPVYLVSLTKAAQYMSTPGRVLPADTMMLAYQVMSLEAVKPFLQDISLQNSVQTTIDSDVLQLKDNQWPGGGWGKNMSSVPDSMVTAQVIYALLKAGVSVNDEAVGSGITFLLARQQADGSWVSEGGVYSTKYASTTWVIISLPVAVAQATGIDMTVRLTFPDNVTLNSSTPAAEHVGADYLWKVAGVDEIGKDIDLDLTLQDLKVGETRKVADTAVISSESKATEVLQYDDFSMSAEDWQPSQGTWTVENGEYSAYAPGGFVSSNSGNPSWKDYTASVRIMPIATNPYWRAALVVRNSSDGRNYYAIHSHPGGLRIYKVVDGRLSDFLWFPTSIAVNVWHTLGITVQGNRIVFYYNNEAVRAVEDASVASGGVALFAWSDSGPIHVHFDDFKVSHDVVNTSEIPIAIPEVTGIAPINVGVSTDKIAYAPDEDVAISTIITNVGADVLNPTVRVSIEDASGNLVSEVADMPVNNLDPNVPQTYNFTWNTGTTIAGDYVVRAKVYENGVFLTDSVAHFTISQDKAITSKITTDKISYPANQPVEMTSTITSLSGNYIFMNLSAAVSVADPQGNVVLSVTNPVAILTPGQLDEFKTYWNTTESPKGTYTVTLTIFDGTTVLSTSSTTFEVLGTSATGDGLAGTLTASPSPVFPGKEETLAYTVTNLGNEDLPVLDLTILIVDPDTQVVKQTLTIQGSVAMGATISGLQSATTSGLSPKIYLAILQAQTPGMQAPKTLASANFEVKPGLDITKTIPDISRVLVWLDYQWQSGQGCPDRSLIEQALNDAGVSYKIVLDKKDFEPELRNPYYTDFLILGDQLPIEDHFSEELREQVYSGKGLIASMFERQNLDADVFGIGGKSGLSGSNYPIELLDSDLASAGVFQSSGNALKVDALDPLEVVGWIVETTKKGTNEYPGIIERQYGKGKVLYYAFDLGMSSGDYGAFATLLKNSLSHVHTPLDTAAIGPRQLVPVEITLTSLGAAFDLQLTESYPDALRLYDPVSGSWVADNPWIMNVPLEPGETKTVLYYALTPDEADTFSTQTEVGYIDGGVYNFYQTLTTDITAQKDIPTVTGDILSRLNALNLTGQQKAKADNAIKYIQNVQTRTITGMSDIEMNISDLLNAVDSLLFITDGDTTDIRLMMDSLLEYWEGAAYGLYGTP
ncbi:MAG: carboxypeptidase regulatory-like domain-containing protein [Nitrospiraceae bacterium]|nr:carboxypeptidase regulatory-like domain-containing protein [Nitrospiraceae bacterium]